MPVATAADLVAKLYGKRGTLHPLAYERDQVYRLDTPDDGSYVLRVSGEHEPLASLHLQNAALQRIALHDPTLPVPRVCASLHGRCMEEVDGTHGSYRLRLLTFVP